MQTSKRKPEQPPIVEKLDNLKPNTLFDYEQKDIVDPTQQSNVVEREYTKEKLKIKGTIPSSVPEPDNTIPTLDLDAPDELPPVIDSPTKQPKAPKETKMPKQPREPKAPKEPKKPISEGYGEMPKKDQKKSSKQLASTIVLLYCTLSDYLRDNHVKFNMDKMYWKSLRGKFDMHVLDVVIPMGGNESISVGELLTKLNEVADVQMVCTDEFKQEAEALLAQILSTRGIGLTPEQELMLLIAQDAIMKFVVGFGISKQVREILEIAKNLMKKANIEPESPTMRVERTEQREPEPEQKKEVVLEPEEKSEDNNETF